MYKLRWDSHRSHWELLKEFYYANKYIITEQLKDALLDALDCMEYTMTEEGENYKDNPKQMSFPKGYWINDGDCLICSYCGTSYNSWFTGSNYCPNCGADMRSPETKKG